MKFCKESLLAAVIIFGGSLCLASSAFGAGWNPNNIISDAQFAAYTTMSENDIQNFLVTKGSYLANYYETRSNLMGYPERYQAQGKRASHIIWWTANEYGLNPQVILATLQKEQSLVTMGALNQYGLDWAMGYGVPDSGERDSSMIGFSRQVDWGSWQLKYNMDKANMDCNKVAPYCTNHYIIIDGQSVYLENGATASLYRYTPHFHGNQNFYTIMSIWFIFSEKERIIYNLSVTSPLVLSDPDPISGQEISSGFVLRNFNKTAVTLSNVGVASRCGSINTDYGWNGPVTLSAYGESGDYIHFNTSESVRTCLGPETTWVSFKYQNNFYAAISLSAQNTILNYNIRKPDIKATTEISISPNQLAGLVSTYTTTIVNNESRRINFDFLGLANRNEVDWSNNDLGWEQNVYIDPQSTKILSFSKSLPRGSYYAWTSYKIGSVFTAIWDDLNINHRKFNVRIPNIKATTEISIIPFNPVATQEITFTTTVINGENQQVCPTHLGIANRNQNTGSNQDIGWYTGLNTCIEAKSTKKLSFKKVLSAGFYKAWTSIQLDSFYEIRDEANVNHIYFTVK